jgi:hypothetical protein
MPQAATIDASKALTEGCIEEGLDMTFQVALIGSDGVIVGSDRKQLHHTPSTPGVLGALQPDLITKFSRSKNDDVVCAFAGEGSARSMADAIVSLPECSMKVTDFEWRIAIRKTVESRQERGRQDEVIVIRKDDLHRAYLASSYSAAPTEVSSRIATGNQAYPARFLLHHFYEKRPVAELINLALLTLHCAAIESEGRIGGGFDLMMLNASGMRWRQYREDDAAVLEAWESFEQSAETAIYGNNS